MCEVFENYSLKGLNTFGVDVKARYFVEFTTDDEIIGFLKEFDARGKRVLILSGGSNILFTKDFDGWVFKINTKGIEQLAETKKNVYVRAKAGEKWDDLVAWSVRNKLGGLENLSLIPGCVGAAPVQNIGAYGVEQSNQYHSLDAVNIYYATLRKYTRGECRFGYRNSIFKKELSQRVIILSVTYRLDKIPEFITKYGALELELKSMGIENPDIESVRNAVIAIRNRKLPDPENLGNAGSFYKNPTVTAQKYNELKLKYPNIIAYTSGTDHYKLAAGWLIDSTGWRGVRRGDAGVCETQALVLVNHGNATGEEILALANEIEKSVILKFGIRLEREVNLIE
jgi:UDP-N-acetylmuramate dehydrogenase